MKTKYPPLSEWLEMSPAKQVRLVTKLYMNRCCPRFEQAVFFRISRFLESVLLKQFDEVSRLYDYLYIMPKQSLTLSEAFAGSKRYAQHKRSAREEEKRIELGAKQYKEFSIDDFT